MKKLIVFIFLFHIIHLQAQIDGAQKCVEDFFEAFHLTIGQRPEKWFDMNVQSKRRYWRKN